MLPRKQSDSGEDVFHSEKSITILDILEKRPFGNEVEALTSPSLYLVKARLNDDTISSGEIIVLPSEKIGPLSEIRYKDISSTTQSELVEAIMNEIRNTPDGRLSDWLFKMFIRSFTHAKYFAPLFDQCAMF